MLSLLRSAPMETGEPEFFFAAAPAPAWKIVPGLMLPLFLNKRFLATEFAIPGEWAQTVAWLLIGIAAAIWVFIAVHGQYERIWRVLPGRLDLMESKFLSPKPRRTETLMLRDVVVECDVAAMSLRVQQTDSRGATRTLDLAYVADPLGFVFSVIRNSLTDRPTPSIPDDGFIG